MMNGHTIEFGNGNVPMNVSPIRADWILEGNPISRNRLLSTSADSTACTLFWDCTAGRFNWFYDIDETVYVLEGSVTIKFEAGNVCRLVAGDWVFFPKGSSAEWTVENYVRKIAFCRSPLPMPVQFARRVYRALKRLGSSGSSPSQVPSMFQ
jgi:uncharacterized cupin superfamily protein